MKKANLQRSESWRPRELLRYAETRAVAIRKLLKLLERRKGRRSRGITDDAVRLAETIEQLARLGRASPAEEAAEINFQLEVLTSLLEAEIDQIVAS